MISHVIYCIYSTYESHMTKTISSVILTAPESISRDSHMTKSYIITHGSGGVFSPDEEVEEEAHAKEGGGIESGRQKSSLLPVGAFQGLVESGSMVACSRSEAEREGGS